MEMFFKYCLLIVRILLVKVIFIEKWIDRKQTDKSQKSLWCGLNSNKMKKKIFELEESKVS